MRTFAVLLLALIPVLARAQFEPGAARAVGLPSTKLEYLILNIVNAVLVVSAVLALGFLVYGGFRYITSRGDDTQVESAKTTITYAIVGLIVIGVAAALVNFVVGVFLGGGQQP